MKECVSEKFEIKVYQGFVLPVISSMVAQWFPPLERSSVVAIYTSGNSLSVIIGNPIAALLCTSAFLDGWPTIFYFCGNFETYLKPGPES
jgi:MFS family permease